MLLVELRGRRLDLRGRPLLLCTLRFEAGSHEGGVRGVPARGQIPPLWRSVHRRFGLGTWQIELDSRRLQWSDSVYELFGVDRERFVPTLESAVLLVAEEDRAELVRAQREAIEGRRPFDFTHRVRLADSSLRVVRQVAEFGTGAGGRVLAGIVQDLTPLKQAELEAEAGRSLARMAGEVAHLGGWRYEPGSHLLRWSEETARIYGLDHSEGIEPERVLERVQEESREALIREFRDCALKGQPFDRLLRIHNLDGSLS